MAIFLDEKVPGISISKEIQDRIKLKGREAGIEIAREMLIELKKIADGVHIMPICDSNFVLEVVDLII